jgi:diguanylate cyclase (GGDEF)-like protein
VDADGRQARLIAAAGRRPPSSVATSGTPLGWVAETGTALPLEPPPDWVDPTATLVAARLPRGEAAERATHMLTLELPRDTIATPALLTCAAAFVGGALDHDAERTRHAGELARSRQLLVALQVLPRETEPSAFADRLLETALLLTGGSGAALASWTGEDGEILHSRGNDGGPQPGETIESPRSEMALAARAGATIVRARAAAKGQAVPIANRSECWNVRPRTWATVPLRNGDDVVGTISVWGTGEEDLHESGIGMLDAIARLSGAQLSIVRSLGALRHSAERDPLTGLFNRRGFDRIFAAEVARTERYGRPVAVLAIDIDHFKSINDRFGHDAGDVALRAVAQTIAATIREADTAARVGGEEFLVLMPETGLLAAREAAERVRRHVAALRSRAPELATDVRVSIGVSTVPDCVAHPSLLLGTADEALYAAKRTGRDRVCDARDARGGVEKGVDLA